MKNQKEDPVGLAYQFFQAKQIERTSKALEKNGFESLFVPDAKAALKAILDMIPDGTSVGIGGSMTLTQIGFFQGIKGRQVNLINPLAKSVTPEERNQLSRKIFSCDYFLPSTNAITDEGQLYNVDANGNRVAAMFFGP